MVVIRHAGGLLFGIALLLCAGDLVTSSGAGRLVLARVADTPLAYIVDGLERFAAVLLPPPHIAFDVRSLPLQVVTVFGSLIFLRAARDMGARAILWPAAAVVMLAGAVFLALDVFAAAFLGKSGTISLASATRLVPLNSWHVSPSISAGWAHWAVSMPASAVLMAVGFLLWIPTLHRSAFHGWWIQIPGKTGRPGGGSGQGPLKTPSPPLASLFKTADREFLPASIEILATPPSPVATSLAMIICLGFCAALAWSYFSWLDIHAVAQGKIQPSGRSKVVQPLEPGRVANLLVENGSSVRVGDLLVELDPTETTADRDAQAKDFEASVAEVARRRAAIGAATAGQFDKASIVFPADVGSEVALREEGVMRAELGLLRATTESLKSQIAEKVATKERLKLSINARQKLISLAKERVGMREEIETRGAGSRAMIIEALTQYETHVTTDATERGQLLEAEAALISLMRKSDEAISQFVADQSQKLAEIDRKRERLYQELIKAQTKSDRTRLRSPIDGTVQQLSITTVGQVVSSAQSLMTVVPYDSPIEIEILLQNKDIGFVKVGQSAVVKVDAFPFTRYGTIDAEVTKVSRDAVEDRDPVTLGDVSNVARAQGPSTQPSSRVQALVFPVTLKILKPTIQFEGEEFRLAPGMSVVVEIKTGRRRALSYLLSPLHEALSQTARER